MKFSMRLSLIYTSGTQLAIQIIGLGTGILVARLLGAEGRGEVAAILSWTGVLAYLGNLGLPVALAYASARFPEQRHQLLGNGVVLALAQWILLGCAGSLILPWVLLGHGSELARLATLFLWAYLPLNLLTLYANAVQQGAGQYRAYNMVRLSVPVGYALVLILLWILHRFTIETVIFANFISNIVALLVVFSLLLPGLVQSSRGASHAWLGMTTMRRDFKYGVTAQVGTLQPFSGLQMDVLALTLLGTTRDLGLYAVALAGANLVRAQGWALGQVVLTEVARRTDIRDQVRLVFKVVLIAAAGGGIALIAVLGWGERLLELIYGAEFGEAATTLEILVLAAGIKAIERVLADGLRGMGQPAASTKAELVGLVVGVPALVMFVPYGSVAGAAAAVLLASAASLGAIAWYGRSLLPVSRAGAFRHAD